MPTLKDRMQRNRQLFAAAFCLVLAVAGVSGDAAASESPYGLYGRSVGAYYAYLWEDGHFAIVKPKWDKSGRFDFAATSKAYPGDCGTFEMEPESHGERVLHLTFPNGGTNVATLYRSGTTWELNAKVRYEDSDIFSRKALLKLHPINPEVLGTSQFDLGHDSFRSGGTSIEGAATVDIATGNATHFQFQPNNRFFVSFSGYLVTTTNSDLGGGSVPINGSGRSRNIQGAGTYKVEGFLLSLKFDDGRFMRDIVTVWGNPVNRIFF
jgi:hypothetical protein